MTARLDPLHTLRLFLTSDHPCSYLPNRLARHLVAEPAAMTHDLYVRLAGLGFRRSGDHVYRPHCLGCRACLSLRIPTATFQPNRAQRRIWRRNADITTHCEPARFAPEHYRLFAHYLQQRHPDGEMDADAPESYLNFITAGWSDTWLCEFRLADRLLAVAVIDRLADGLSAVYTFFDPAAAERSPGVYAVLWQIDAARRLGLPWVYLGYWVEQCRKMSYKANFRPHEIFREGRWAAAAGRAPAAEP